MTPFWHEKSRSAYPQKTKYDEFLTNVRKYCVLNKVNFIDASYILSKDNFGVYKRTSNRDKIDVLHFNADGHFKLANYIIKELNL